MGPWIVKAKDLLTGVVKEITVSNTETIDTQEKAESFVANLPKSAGGSHVGLEVVRSTKPEVVKVEPVVHVK